MTGVQTCALPILYNACVCLSIVLYDVCVCLSIVLYDACVCLSIVLYDVCVCLSIVLYDVCVCLSIVLYDVCLHIHACYMSINYHSLDSIITELNFAPTLLHLFQAAAISTSFFFFLVPNTCVSSFDVDVCLCLSVVLSFLVVA